jgi:hypothetical protein
LSRSISSRATEFGSYFGSDILGTFFDEDRECDRTHRAPRHGKPRSGRRPSERTTFLSHGSTTPILSHRERRRAVSSLLTAFRTRITDCTSWITVYRGALRTAITTPTATYGPKPLGEALVKDEWNAKCAGAYAMPARSNSMTRSISLPTGSTAGWRLASAASTRSL